MPNFKKKLTLKELSRRKLFWIVFFSLASASVFAHKTNTHQAQKKLMIPELLLESTPLVINKSQHLHIGRVTQKSRPGGGRYTCGPLPQVAMDNAITALKGSLAKVESTNLALEYLILCDGVTANNQKIGGIPVPPLQLLMLSVSDTDSQYVVHLFWHELFHFLEIKAGFYNDSVWGRQFTGYLQRYELSDAGSTKLGSGQAGFINRYGQSFAHEERAELAAWILAKPDKLEQFIVKTGDKVLQEKVKYMQRRLEQLGFK